jgi:hypothetical protein
MVATFLTIACAADRASSPNALVDAAGTWNALGEVPGSGEQWKLSVTGSAVTGTGTWTGEACCAGDVTISGTALGDSLHLDITYSKLVPVPDTVYSSGHLDAVLATHTDLVGTFTRDGGIPGHVHFAKQL